MKTKFLILIIVLFASSNMFSQNLYSVINSAIEDCRNGRQISQYQELNDFLNKTPYDVALSIRNYSIDSSASVRQFVANILGRTGVLCESENLRKNICEIISELTKDKSKEVRKEAFNKLKYFKKSDFNETCKLNIFNSFRKRMQLDPISIKVAGYIAPNGLDTILRNVINETSKDRNDIIWASKIALTRLGNKEAEYYCISTVEKYGLNDAVVYDVLPDLVYTKTKSSIELIIKLLQDDSNNCSSPNPDYSGKITCSYRIMEILAPIIIDFPLKTTLSGDLLTNDYPQALKTTRQWFSEHSENYVINDLIY